MSKPSASDPPLIRSRRAAREAAFQALYAIFVGHQPEEQVLADLKASTRFHPDLWPFIENLVEAVRRDPEGHDERFSSFLAKGWPLAQIAIVDRIILRLAVEELWSHVDVPPKVTIIEYVNLANKYGSKDSQRFVHGVLGNVVAVSPKANWVEPETPNYEEIEPELTSGDDDEIEAPKPTAPWVLRPTAEPDAD
ncbi:MAG: transcription antitermination factor NusB [Fimbriimonadaceae bacterium]|nr:transcription antitermination factor NusB [Fimbriimonadaceae bacterium]